MAAAAAAEAADQSSVTTAPTTLPKYHASTVTVPGAPAGWVDAVVRWGSGRLSLAELVEPSARLAEDGFPLGPIAAHLWAKGEPQLRQSANCREMLSSQQGDGDGDGGDGLSAPVAGERFRRPGLAKALRLLGEKGRAGFYEGDVALAIVEEVQQNGSVIREGAFSGARRKLL